MQQKKGTAIEEKFFHHNSTRLCCCSTRYQIIQSSILHISTHTCATRASATLSHAQTFHEQRTRTSIYF